jgi:solute carrier family 39 (zinc transporter), member 9
MNQTLMVFMMALGLFVSTFFIGYLPTKFNPPQKWLNLISIYGAGLLVGAAIIVILPEGMLVLFESLVNKEVL